MRSLRTLFTSVFYFNVYDRKILDYFIDSCSDVFRQERKMSGLPLRLSPQ